MGAKPIPAYPERVERLYMLMEREGLSGAELARRIGTSQQRMSEILISQKISSYYLLKIQRAFPNYLPEWFFGKGDPSIATRDDLIYLRPEVIRCKHCEHHHDGNCSKHKITVCDNDYCSFARSK